MTIKNISWVVTKPQVEAILETMNKHTADTLIIDNIEVSKIQSYTGHRLLHIRYSEIFGARVIG